MRREPQVRQAIRAVRRRLAAGEITAARADRLISQIRLDHYTSVLTALQSSDPPQTLDHDTVSDTLSDAVSDAVSGTGLPGAGFTGVGVRLTGTRHEVGAVLALLDQVTDLAAVSDPYPHAAGRIRVYAKISRRTGLTGGAR